MSYKNKISVFSLSIAAYLTHALPTFARHLDPNVDHAPATSATDQGINPCPSGIGSICTPSSIDPGTIIGRVITILFVIAAVIAVMYLIWGGIKWIMSGGDKAKVEAARSTIIGAIIGLVVVFASYFIITLVLKLLFNVDLNNLKIPTLI